MTPSLPRASEKAIHAAVIAHWRAFGVPGSLVATIPNMGAFGQSGLFKGLPDLLVLSPELPVGFIELKREGGKARAEQTAFGAMCAALEINHAITFGRDEPIRILEAWGVVRAQACGRPVNRGDAKSIIPKQNQGRGKFQATKSEPVEK